MQQSLRLVTNVRVRVPGSGLLERWKSLLAVLCVGVLNKVAILVLCYQIVIADRKRNRAIKPERIEKLNLLRWIQSGAHRARLFLAENAAI